MTRAEHFAWCKQRAVEYVERGELANAVTSMLSDLSKHPGTAASADGICAQIGMFELMNGPTRAKITKYIQGFN